MEQEFETIDDIVLSCINKTRPQTSPELWERYAKACKRANVLAIPGQCRAAVTRILRSGRAAYDRERKTIVRI